MKKSTLKSLLLLPFLLFNYLLHAQEPDSLAYARAEFLKFIESGNRTAQITWQELGPDNFGGRTRALNADLSNSNHLLAGSVSGGLYESWDSGLSWNYILTFTDNLVVSTISQSSQNPDTWVIGTGHINELFQGGGLYYSLDNGATWNLLSGTSAVLTCNASTYGSTQDKFYFATNTGLLEIDASNLAAATPIQTPGAPTGSYFDLSSSPDGKVLLAGRVIGSIDTYQSNDYGQTWTDVGGPSAGSIPNYSLTYYAISDSTINGDYYCYTGCSNSTFGEIFMSSSSGTVGTWTQIASGNGLGSNERIHSITVNPNNPDIIYVGTDNIFEGINANGTFQWTQISSYSTSIPSPYFVGRNQYNLFFDAQANLIVGCSEGIFKAPNGNGFVFTPMNTNYHTVQVYGLGYSKHGQIIIGTQSNGTLYNDFSNVTYLGYDGLERGVGFDCDISFFNEDFLIKSLQYGGFERSSDAGITWSTFYSADMLNCGTPGSLSGGLGGYNTVARLWESNTDFNSSDSILYVASSTLLPGDTVFTTGNSLNNDIFSVLSDTLYANDSILIQDPFQSWYAFGLGQSTNSSCRGIWLTRDGLRMNQTPFWWHIDLPLGGFETIKCIEFSNNGNYLYVGTSGGNVFRISGLANVYGNIYSDGYPGHPSSPGTNGDPHMLPPNVIVTQIHTGSNSINGLSVDPQDPGHVVLAVGGFGTNIFESTNADVTTGTGSFTSIQGNLPSAPCYDAVIDRLNPDFIVIGTEFGVYATDDGGVTWTFNSDHFGLLPVYAVRQSWRSWSQGSYVPGQIFIGTVGHGVWASTNTVSVSDQVASNTNATGLYNVKLYPNPVNNEANLEFESRESMETSIKIYSITGTLIQDYGLIKVSKGVNTISLNRGNIPSGIYLVLLKSPRRTESIKVIMQ